MEQKRNGSHLILMELMLVLFFFAICGAILLQVFVKSHNISIKAKELTETKNYVTQVAELFESGCTTIDGYQKYFPKMEGSKGRYQGYFDKNWNMTSKKKCNISNDDQTRRERKKFRGKDHDVKGKKTDLSTRSFQSFSRKEKQ